MKTELTIAIEKWGEEKGIFEKGTVVTQLKKLCEELGEVVDAIKQGDVEEAKLEIGDCRVVLTLLAKMIGSDIDECSQLAYDKISKRNGKMVNGVFVKEEDL